MTNTFLRPSAAARWMACPGSIRICEETASELLQILPGPAAERGTLGHLLIELALRLDLPIVQVAEVLQIDDIELIAAAADIVERINVMITPATRIHIEVKLNIFGMMTGTADLVLVDGARAALIDHKFGSVIVEPTSPQFVAYAAGILECFPEVERLTIIVAQPFARHIDGIWRSRRVTRVELQSEIDSLRRAAAATADPKAPVRAGPYCFWCPARGVCPAMREKAVAAARDAFPTTGDAGLVLAQRLAMRPAIEAWLEDQEASAAVRLQAAGTVPGYALGKVRGSRRWTVDKEEVIRHLVTLGLDIDRVAPRRLASPAAIEAALKLAGEPKSALAGLWGRFGGTVKVVRNTDPSMRPGIEWDASGSMVEDL